MTITARYAGRCTVCGGRIRPGDTIEWDRARGVTAHAGCVGGNAATAGAAAARQPVAAVAGRAGGVQVPRGRNRRPGYCERCGEYLAPGQGQLQYCVEDSGCLKHHDYSGYHLYCADTAACEARVAERRAAAQARRERQEAARAAILPAFHARQPVDRLPTGAEKIWSEVHMAGSERWYLGPDGEVYYVQSDYDMGPSYWVVPGVTREHLEAAKVAGLRPSLI